MPETSKHFVCVNCLTPADSLYTIYSQDVIRITECKTCGNCVDLYVEYDNVLIFIDLILQYSTAYRHFLLNIKFETYLRLIFIFLLCNAYNNWIERRTEGPEHEEDENESKIFDLELRFYQALAQSFVEMVVYSVTEMSILYALGKHKYFISPFGNNFRFFFEATLMSFYGNIFVVFSIIWRLHKQWTFRFLTQLFIAISHIQVQKTLCPNIHWLINCTVVVFGMIVQFLSGRLLINASNLYF